MNEMMTGTIIPINDGSLAVRYDLPVRVYFGSLVAVHWYEFVPLNDTLLHDLKEGDRVECLVREVNGPDENPLISIQPMQAW